MTVTATVTATAAVTATTTLHVDGRPDATVDVDDETYLAFSAPFSSSALFASFRQHLT